MWSKVRTFLGVTVVAAMIWVFAEAESLRSVEVHPELLFGAAPGSDRAIDVIEAAGATGNRVKTMVDLEGSAAAIDAAERALRGTLLLAPGMEGVSAEPGEQTVTLRNALRAHPEIRKFGVTIRRVEPQTVRVFIDQLVPVSMPVAVVVPAEQIEGPAEVKPPSVTITLPKSEAARLTAASRATVRVGPEALASLTPGRRQSIAGLAVELPEEVATSNHARLDPARAEVTLMLRAQTRTIKVATVPVHLRIAPGEFGKWDIDIPEQDRFLVDVTVTGPSQAVKLIEDKATPLVATLSLSFEELETAITSKEAVFSDLPAGVRAEAANRTVRLEITRRATPGSPKQ